MFGLLPFSVKEFAVSNKSASATDTFIVTAWWLFDRFPSDIFFGPTITSFSRLMRFEFSPCDCSFPFLS
jgi:hypothetical protein